jgi:hypothetical protein
MIRDRVRGFIENLVEAELDDALGFSLSDCTFLLDARGHGQNDKPHDAAAHALTDRVGDVVAVLDTIGV